MCPLGGSPGVHADWGRRPEGGANCLTPRLQLANAAGATNIGCSLPSAQLRLRHAKENEQCFVADPTARHGRRQRSMIGHYPIQQPL